MLDGRIINLIETKFNEKLNSSAACERLGLDIESVTGERLGFTTLKRLLGFTSEKAAPRQSTLEILAGYLGFKSYRELEDSINNRGDSNFNDEAEAIYSSQLPPMEEINLSYSPDRFLKLRHIKDDEFLILESINGSLKKGDIIFADSFISGLPMIAKNVVRDGESLGRYKAGGNFGIKIIRE